ncbi:hypothetical protein [Kordia jejudonensis]|uniref:hypothetical protein n=1 Tax=Kordia jejudonensis TaxID=1348245 RepID=UPI00138E45F8|nr:hypothetical protein [Kordia jejudonensis]
MMKNLTKESILAIIEKKDTVLLATQKKVCLPIINRIYQKMKYGIKFDDIKVCGALVIDGHHRYICSLLVNIDIDRAKSSKTSATVAFNWQDVEFVEEEWDTEDKIKQLNELDADFNNMSIEEITEIIK